MTALLAPHCTRAECERQVLIGAYVLRASSRLWIISRRVFSPLRLTFCFDLLGAGE